MNIVEVGGIKNATLVKGTGANNRDQTSYGTGWWYRWGTISLVAVVFDFFGW